MRPLELRLAHFGPYRDEAVLDFEGLDRLFLVCGPTGAGKTTLFDALTYALYERTPGTRGGLGDQLASHHAPEGSVPRVSLRFALGAQEYRVTRHLKHKVLKQRGEGWRDQDAQVMLEKKIDAGWEPVTGKRSEINQRLEDLVGLSAEEFSKIVVLPQGDFQRFLEASSNDREKMLQKLFPVEAYERVVDGLKARAKTVEDERRRWEDRWQDLTAKLGSEPRDVVALEADQADANAHAQEAARLEAEAAATLERLKAWWVDWNTLIAKRQEKAVLDQRRPGIDVERGRLEAARKARPWGADLDRQDRIVADGKALRADQDGAKARLAAVEESLAEWTAQAETRAAREGRLTELLGQKGVLETRKIQWAEARTLEENETQARALEAQALKAHQAAVHSRSAAEASFPQAPVGPGWDAALAQVEAARTAHDAARIRAEVDTQRFSLETARADADRAAQTSISQREAADHEVELWTQLVDAVRAAALAQTLVPEQPCPVCGSTDHPRPAVVTGAAAEAPLRLEAALGAQAAARQAAAVAQTRSADLASRLEALPPPILGALAVDQTFQALEEAQAQVDALQAFTRARDAARKILDEALATEARAREAWQVGVRNREVWTTRRAALAESIPADPGPLLGALIREEAELRRGLDADRRQVEALTRDQGTLHTRIDEQEKQLSAQRDEFAKLKGALDAGVAALGWTLGDLVAARLPEATLQALEATVAAFDREAHRLDGETLALEAKFPEGAPAPLEPAADALAARRNERQAADALAREKAFALRDRERLESELREVASGKRALEADFQRLVPLAQALDGHNRLNLKLTTWVLIQALESVAQSATHRLASMSGGRYALKVQTQGLDGRKDWGLDLSVIDGYTGQERAVGTLSGGEKFMTSISLALGLADVIQERAGGLKLEAIFIDEGFGTLDDQSLEAAMKILADLGKHRSVGIISHVAELRQRISSRVEVVKGKNGSTLKAG